MARGDKLECKCNPYYLQSQIVSIKLNFSQAQVSRLSLLCYLNTNKNQIKSEMTGYINHLILEVFCLLERSFSGQNELKEVA